MSQTAITVMLFLLCALLYELSGQVTGLLESLRRKAANPEQEITR